MVIAPDQLVNLTATVAGDGGNFLGRFAFASSQNSDIKRALQGLWLDGSRLLVPPDLGVIQM